MIRGRGAARWMGRQAVGREFELKRAARGGAAMVALVAVLVGLNSASFLFPSPVYKPDDKPLAA